MLTADHGPAVSGAHNTIVCARAGKDLISSLVSGLLTIVSSFEFLRFHLADNRICCFKGDRFGGALDGAARQFSEAVDKGWSPMQFVNEMRKQGKHIMGIGHRVKSVNCFIFQASGDYYCALLSVHGFFFRNGTLCIRTREQKQGENLSVDVDSSLCTRVNFS